MLKGILIVVVVLLVGVAGVLAYAATKPSDFRVQRSASIKAPPERIYPLIENFDRWGGWSPYETRDPAMKRTRSGAATGKGAIYEWDGNKDVGQGRMEIIDTQAPNRVTIKLDFLKPFEGHNTAEFTLAPKDGATEVTWAMRGPMAYIAKVMSVFINMDTMIGKDFEVGLANMKRLAEG